ncbi:hypothetical protein DIURU_003353 [Diutina rugosa]|uniref:TRIP4/RQT4 C2HC5-type zinc finger domain-containing protein n=1 Tax=Diutina rugosa TaxID=5481 RepID=A0A642UKZ5_DIURU|nr:uncharacterized protein DIURU_003353 [Diutina rugosa]KAA8900983.1 hypothetical protein DIURU_003353 [Diutina rugosa]
MDYPKTKSFSRNALSQLLPLDTESLNEIIDYTLHLGSPHAIESHLLDILGTSDESLSFVTQFLKLKQEEDDAYAKKTSKQRMSLTKKPAISNQPVTKKSPAWKVDSTESQPSRKPLTRVDPKKTASTTSQLMNEPHMVLNAKQAKRGKRKNMDNLKDIEAALQDLELAEAQNQANRKCDCMGQRHPLFDVVPNCLNCGKIICVKEGLQPCSFCGQQLLPETDREEIRSILLKERDTLEHNKELLAERKLPSQSPPPVKEKKKKITVRSSAGKFWDEQKEALAALEDEKKRQKQEQLQKEMHEKEVKEQEEELKKYEKMKRINEKHDNDLLVAQQRLETLLDFQATGAERTKIIDRAADYDLPTSSSSMWLSPVERALQLKRQQKQLRKQESAEESRKGRGRRVMEMVIVNGKAQMVENTTYSKSDDEEDENSIQELESKINVSKLAEEADQSKQVWNYELDAAKWEKPVYMGNQQSGTLVDTAPPSRLQVSKGGDEMDLVVALP